MIRTLRFEHSQDFFGIINLATFGACPDHFGRENRRSLVGHPGGFDSTKCVLMFAKRSQMCGVT